MAKQRNKAARKKRQQEARLSRAHQDFEDPDAILRAEDQDGETGQDQDADDDLVELGDIGSQEEPVAQRTRSAATTNRQDLEAKIMASNAQHMQQLQTQTRNQMQAQIRAQVEQARVLQQMQQQVQLFAETVTAPQANKVPPRNSGEDREADRNDDTGSQNEPVAQRTRSTGAMNKQLEDMETRMQNQIQAQAAQAQQVQLQFQQQMQQQMQQIQQMFQAAQNNPAGSTATQNQQNQGTTLTTTARIHASPGGNTTQSQNSTSQAQAAPKAKRINLPMLRGPDEISIGEFKDWKEKIQGYAQVERLYEECTLLARKTILYSAMEGHWSRLIKAKTITVQDTDDLDQIMDKIGEHVRRNRNPMLDRINFAKRKQGASEKVDTYHAVLDEMENNADHPFNANCRSCRQAKEERVRDRIVTGLNDPIIQAAVLDVTYQDLTLKRTLDVCRAKEASISNQSSMNDKEICRVYEKPKGNNESRQNYQHQSRDQNYSQDRCRSCGDNHEWPKEECWAFGKICNYCHKKGHVTKACTKRNKPKIPQTSIFCGNVEVKDESTCELTPLTFNVWNESGKYKGKLFNVLPDTGASANIIGQEQSYRLGPIKEKQSSTVLTAANGQSVHIIGIVEAMLKHGQIRKKVAFNVTDEYQGVVLNKQECINFELIPDGWPHVTKFMNSEKPNREMPTSKKQKVVMHMNHISAGVLSEGDNSNVKEEDASCKGEQATKIFQEIVAHFVQVHDQNHLVVVDIKSNYPFLFTVDGPLTAQKIMAALKEVFVAYRCPETIYCERDTALTAHEVQAFLRQWDVNLKTWSPDRNAEMTLMKVDRLLKQGESHRAENFIKGINQIRNTNTDDKESPAEVVFGHQIEYKAPKHWKALNLEWQKQMIANDRKAADLARKNQSRSSGSATFLKQPVIGDYALIQNRITKKWDSCGRLMDRGEVRDFCIKLASGKVTWRNSKFLKPLEGKTFLEGEKMMWHGDHQSRGVNCNEEAHYQTDITEPQLPEEEEKRSD